MDIAWLAIIGVLLLVAGLGALGYDTARRKHDHKPFQFPDEATNLLDDTAVRELIAANEPTSQPNKPPRRLLSGLPRPQLKVARPRNPARKLMQSVSTPRLMVASGCVALLLVALGALAYRTASEPSTPPPGSVVVSICPFMGAPPKNEPSDFLASELAATATASRLSNLIVRPSRVRAAAPKQAESERARLKAHILVWGEMDDKGDLTIKLDIAPNFNVGGNGWEQWTGREPDALVLPERMEISLPATTGVYPIVPLLTSLAQLGFGDYAGAVLSAENAQAAIAQAGGAGQAGTFVQAVAMAALGAYDRAAQLSSVAEGDMSLAPEARVNRAFALLKLSDYGGSRAALDNVIANKDTLNRTLARAHLLIGRAMARLGGDYVGAVAEYDESLRLDPMYTHARLDKADALYRLSEPDPVRGALTDLLKKSPDAAPAHRMMGLVWLMLGKPEEARQSLAKARDIYSRWISDLRAEESKAQVTGDLVAGERATAGIVLLNREVAWVYLYDGMALADMARTQPPEGFLGGLWRRVRGEATVYEQAAASMQEAARLDPRSPDIPLQMGSVYIDMGEPDLAAEAIKQAQSRSPDAPEPYLALTRLQESQGNPTEAAKTLDELISRVPGAYPAYDALYNIYDKSGDKGEANLALRRALAVDPKSPSDHLWRGRFLRTLGRNGEALDELRSASADPALWESHLLMARILQETGRGPDALSQFKAVLAVQPNHPEALLDAGRLLVLAGETTEAEELFKRLTSTSPNSADGHIAFLQLLLSKGDLRGAIAEGQRAVQADGARSDVYYYLGMAYEAQKDWAAASAQYKAAAERDQKSADAFLRWAVSLWREDKYADSVAAADTAVQLRPDDPQGYRWKAEAQFALRAPDEALKTLEQALKLSPQYSDALALAARANSLKGNHAPAEANARKAIAADSRNIEGQLALGEVLLASGRNAEAGDAFTAAMELDAQSAEAITGQGRAFAAMGNVEQARKLYANALEADPRYAAAHLYAGHSHVAQGNWDDALGEYSAAVRLRPNWPEGLYYSGRAYLQKKDLRSAQRYLDVATKYGPNLVEAWFGLGIAHRGLGQTREAIDALAHAVQLNGNYPEAWLYLGLTYEETGERGAAAEAFANAQRTAIDSSIRQQAEQGLARLK